jgi:hypothetical protein
MLATAQSGRYQHQGCQYAAGAVSEGVVRLALSSVFWQGLHTKKFTSMPSQVRHFNILQALCGIHIN